MKSVDSVVNEKEESQSQPNLESEKKDLAFEEEEKAIKEISQKITAGIPATAAISLGEKLLIQGEKLFGKITPDNSDFYNWAKRLTELKEDGINEYIKLYQEFKDVQSLIRDWINKSHLIHIKKYSDRHKISKETVINILISLDKNEEVKTFRVIVQGDKI